MKYQWGKSLAIALIALSISACKGTDTKSTVYVEGYGEVTDGESVCTDKCTKPLPLNWLQAQLRLTRSVTYTAMANPGYEFFGWVDQAYTNRCQSEDQCTLTVEARCDDILDFRSSGLPCQELSPLDRSVTAVFVEQNTIGERFWSADSACMISTSDEIRCWGDPDLENNVPQVVNPYELKMRSDVACVKDDRGLQCWGNLYQLGETQPVLVEPEAFLVGYRIVCAIDLGQVVCWGADAPEMSPTPELSQPTRITFASPGKNVCAIDTNGLSCWGNDEAQSAPLGNGDVVHLPNYDCTITEESFDCSWFVLAREDYL